MKKMILILVVVALAPIMAFADFGLAVGPAAFLKSPVLLGQAISSDDLNVTQGSFGVDVRYVMGWFQADGLILFSAGSLNSFNAYLDAGVSLDMAPISFSVGAGPNFTGNFDSGTPLQAGLNAKVGADLRLGSASVGLSYIMAMNLDDGIRIRTGYGLLGAHFLFWL